MTNSRKRSDTTDIYSLKDPETSEVRYVGRARDAVMRLYWHMVKALSTDGAKNRWLQSLFSRGLCPIVVILEVVPCAEAAEAEKRWIRKLSEEGADLTNVLHNRPIRIKARRMPKEKFRIALCEGAKRGRGRPKGSAYPIIMSIRLTEEQNRWLKEMAVREGGDAVDVLRRLINRAMGVAMVSG